MKVKVKKKTRFEFGCKRLIEFFELKNNFECKCSFLPFRLYVYLNFMMPT